jgi:tetratricopeptide (TPR) repeat protein
MQQRSTFYSLLVLGSALFIGGCATTKAAKPAPTPLASGSCAMALALHKGEAPIDSEIRSRQGKIKQINEQLTDATPNVEKLGWRFIEKARRSYDPGYYKLAEQCAACMEELQVTRAGEPGKLKNAAALLLRGHILQNLHRFNEAEPIARELAAKRGLAFDHMLLGDVLLEQGKLDDAAHCYQKVMDLKPGLQAYARAAQLRWLQGDTEGAIEMALQATRLGTPSDPEAGAWAATKLAFFDLHYGALPQAAAACETALELMPQYAPALLLKGRVLLAQERASAAIPFLQEAARQNPLPEYQWTLADALRAEKRDAEAQAVETTLQTKGAVEDPRTYALYLATRSSDSAQALKLAEDELKNRQDLYSYDALAWALMRNGQTEAAWQTMQKALATGAQDARLHFHAAAIAQARGLKAEARQHFKQARKGSASLLPSERSQLIQLNS